MKYKILKILLKTSILKTLIFNIKYFGLKGLTFPVLIGHKVELNKLGGKIIINNPKFGHIKLGIYTPANYSSNNISTFFNNGIIIFNTKASLGTGFRLCNSGKITFGYNFSLTANSSVLCNKEICFGDNNTVSWTVEIMDTDIHKIFDKNNNIINSPEAVVFGNNTWICSGAKILKGSSFSDTTIIAANSCIANKKFDKQNIIIADNGKIIKEGMDWNY